MPRVTRSSSVPKNTATYVANSHDRLFSLRLAPSDAGRGLHRVRNACHRARDAFCPGAPPALEAVRSAGLELPDGGPSPPPLKQTAAKRYSDKE